MAKDMKKVWGHFCTITHHKILVMKHCFRVGLYKQGILHDLSKYMPSEFLIGCKYYQGREARTMRRGKLPDARRHGCTIRGEISITMNTGSIMESMERKH